jgi:hypothetical protein
VGHHRPAHGVVDDLRRLVALVRAAPDAVIGVEAEEALSLANRPAEDHQVAAAPADLAGVFFSVAIAATAVIRLVIGCWCQSAYQRPAVGGDPRTNLGERFFSISKFRLEFSQRDPKVGTKFVVVLLENPLRCLIHFLAKSLLS